MGSVSVYFIIFCCICAVDALNITVNLNRDKARKYHGQLIAYYTFSAGAGNSLSFHLNSALDASSKLFLFAAGSQRTFSDGSKENCLNFYRMAISNVSLNSERGFLKIGSFTGNFPTFLVFADNQSCDETRLVRSGQTIAHIRLLTAHNHPLSATLVGLPEYYLVLMLFYIVSILYTVYCIHWALFCCGTQHSLNLPLSTVSKGFGFLNRRVLRRIDIREKRLFLLCSLLFVNLVSLGLAYSELIRISQVAVDLNEISLPWFGANTRLGQLAEAIALIGHFVYITLLVISVADVTLGPKCRKPMLLPRTEDPSNCCNSALSDSSFSLRFPVLSTFRLGSPLVLIRVLWVLAIAQCVWYLLVTNVFSESFYTTPNRWPLEESNAFSAGLGLTGRCYAPSPNDASTSTGFTSLLSTLVGSNSILSIVFLSARILLGLFFSAKLSQFSSDSKRNQIGEMYGKFALLGFIWFMLHPVVGTLGVLLLDHARHKTTIIGVTIVQAMICAYSIRLFTQRKVLWEVSALSDSIPTLQHTQTNHSKS